MRGGTKMYTIGKKILTIFTVVFFVSILFISSVKGGEVGNYEQMGTTFPVMSGYDTIFLDDEGISWYIKAFTSDSDTWIIPSYVNEIDILVVAGGGGSGKGTTASNYAAGGGGAGGVVWIQGVTQLGDTVIVPDNIISYSVGKGGSGATSTSAKGDTGGDSMFGDLTAKGGGGGGSSSNVDGAVGGSGGGGGGNSKTGGGGNAIQTSEPGWSGEYGYGNNGGNSYGHAWQGAGGGGAMSQGETWKDGGGSGGDGIDMSDYFGTYYGNNGIFASGGGATNVGIDAVVNSGMGGRAQSIYSGANGRPGADGIILIRWKYEPEFDEDISVEEPILVDIDIKPGGRINTINRRSKGVVPVAILGRHDFDTAEVDATTVIFLGAKPNRYSYEDVDSDGYIDIVLMFKTQDLDFGLLVDEDGKYPYAYLTGETFFGDDIEGKDTVRLI